MSTDQSLLDEFIVESKEHLANIESDFLQLEKQNDPANKSLIDRIFRAIHSIKGSSGFLNLKTVTRLSHSMEALLQKVRDGHIQMQTHHIDTLLKGVDQLRQLLEDPLKDVDIRKLSKELKEFTNTVPEEKTKTNNTKSYSNKQIPEKQQIEMSQLNDFGFSPEAYHFSESQHLFIIKTDLFVMESKKKISPISFIFDFESMGKILDCRLDNKSDTFSGIIQQKKLTITVLYETLLTHDEISLMLFVPEQHILVVSKNSKPSHDLPGAKKSIEKTTGEAEFVQNKLEPVKEIQHKENYPNQIHHKKQSPEIPDHSSQQEIKPDKLKTSTNKEFKSESIRINIDLLDKIMNLAGELVLVRNQQLLEVDKSNPRQVDISQRLDIVTSELQEAIMRTRMQPVGNLFSKLPRMIRDLGKKMKKSILMITNGDDVELDKNILESLSDPMFHIIRNSCDHGIESPKERLTKGKSETGYIKIQAYHEAGQINIKIEDDGRGINTDIIKNKVLKAGLKSNNELSRMNEKDLLNLIMLPGFTTSEKTTEISGRGVGMDVLKEAVEQMSGSIDLTSEPGQGTCIHLRLPLTLAIIPSLIVIVDKERFAIPEINVEEIVSLYDNDIYTMIEIDGDQEVFRLRNDLLPLVRLNEILIRTEKFTESTRFEISQKYKEISKKFCEKNSDDQQQKVLIFAVLKIGNQRFGLIIDEIIGTEEIVVNPLHSIVKPLKIYSGTTIMGDGAVALILDVNGISEHTQIKFSSHSEIKFQKGNLENTSDTHRVLLFKSGKKEQFAIPLILLRRVEIIAPKKIQEIGDKSYISLNGQTTLIIRLESLLNVSPLMEEEKKMYLLLPKQTKIPVGILIARITDVINMPLTLSKQDFMEDGLLGTSLMNDTITLFLDLFKIVEKAIREIVPAEDFVSENQLQHQSFKILLAEDTSFFRRLIKGQLVSAGYDVTTAENGAIALEMLQNNSFDLLISDIEMPEMDGLTLIKTIRKNEKLKHIPAISVTSLDSPEDKAAGYEAGFNAYHLKADKKNLITSIHKLLKQKH